MARIWFREGTHVCSESWKALGFGSRSAQALAKGKVPLASGRSIGDEQYRKGRPFIQENLRRRSAAALEHRSPGPKRLFQTTPTLGVGLQGFVPLFSTMSGSGVALS